LGLFVGAGFNVGVVEVKAGVEGVVSLAELTMPAFASAGLNYIATTDDREIVNDLPLFAVGPFSGKVALHVRPKKYALSLHYGANLAAHITDLLSGSVGLKVKARFAFFTKSWKKKVATWTGLCGKRPGEKGRKSWCDIDLINFGGEVNVVESIPWANVKLPFPFVQFKDLTERDEADMPEEEIDALDLTRAEQFRYDRLCNPPIIIN
jgi:hypothetical protein